MSEILRTSPRAPFLGALLIAALLVSVPAGAEMCTSDVVPAATLLLPYFEVDLNDPTGTTTLMSINNSGPEPALGHITFWTDWSQPTIDFDVFLTGYDVVTINFRDVFQNGVIPLTADLQSDPDDDISPHGQNPEWDGSFPVCDQIFPFLNNPVLTGSLLERLVNGHTGIDVGGSGCLGSATGDNVARGYVTVDSAARCSVEFPWENGYFGDVDPVADDRNVLWGDFFLVDVAEGTSVGAPLVHVEAETGFDTSATASGYTFYGRYTQDTDGNDHREPLGSAWGFGYSTNPEVGASTEILVWRDSSQTQIDSTFFTCGEGPSWVGLRTDPMFCFDEEENPAEVCRAGDCLPLATQRATMGEGSLATPFDAGWCWIDFTTRDADTASDVDYPVGDPDGELGQGWVGALYTLDGTFSGGFSSVQLRSACDADFGVGLLGFFRDGFESGDLAAWSAASP